MISRSKKYFLRASRFPALLLTAAVFGCAFLLGGGASSCIYRFNESVIPDTIKTVKVNIFENNAPYNNPQVRQRLSDRLRQKIVSQTKLKQTNGDDPDWEIDGTITQYSLSTSAISNQQVVTNRLTVVVHIVLDKHKDDKVEEFDVSRSFEFRGSQSLQQAEATLMDEMIRTLSDEIFNQLFSGWK